MIAKANWHAGDLGSFHILTCRIQLEQCDMHHSRNQHIHVLLVHCVSISASFVLFVGPQNQIILH